MSAQSWLKLDMQPGFDRDDSSAGTGDLICAISVLHASEVFQASANFCTASRSLKSALVILEGKIRREGAQGQVGGGNGLYEAAVKQDACLSAKVNDRSVSFPVFFLIFRQHS